ncbi:hypothetical protein TNCV_2433161 [Trichonephila clavipes]|nr:hypothetical protein TNCV_2433161 [Trichonephila clavipes]
MDTSPRKNPQYNEKADELDEEFRACPQSSNLTPPIDDNAVASRRPNGPRSYIIRFPYCPNVQLSPQHILRCPAIHTHTHTQARLFKISPEDLIFSDKAVEVDETTFDSFEAI